MNRFLGEGLRFNPWALGAFFCATVCAGMCLYVIIWRSRAHIRPSAFVPVAAVTVIWNLGWGIDLLMEPVGRPAIILVVASAMAWSAPAALLFVTAFVGLQRRRWWLGGMAMAALISSWLIWTDPQIILGVRPALWGGRTPLLGPHGYLIAAPLGAGVFFSFGLAFRGWRCQPPGRRRQQLGYVVLALCMAMLGGIDLLAAARVLAPPMPLGWMTSLAATAIGFYATVTWRLLSIRVLLARMFFWLLLAVGAAVPLATIIYASRDWPGWRSPPTRVAAVVGLMAGMHFYLAWFERRLRRILNRNERTHEAVMIDFAAGLRQQGGTGFQVGPLSAALRRLGVELNVVAWSVDAGDGAPASYLAAPDDAKPVPRKPGALLPAHSVAREELERCADLPTEDLREREHAALDQEALVWLDAYDANLLIPLGHGSQTIGAIVATMPSGQNFGVLRGLLDRFATHLSVALINLELVRVLEARSKDLERTVEIRTSELARVLDELKDAQVSLVHAERQSSLGVLVAGVSHEINNALNFISGNLPALALLADTYRELIARSREAEVDVGDEFAVIADKAHKELTRAVKAVDVASRQARMIVDDLRRFARRDEGERAAANVSAGLVSTLNLLGAEFLAGVRLERRVADVPDIVCYPGALNHVFLNVILNAVQASVDVPAAVVTVQLAAAEHGGVLVVVTDQGEGIAEELRARIFEPFFTTRKKNAAGLGLALAREVVERHGGTIDVTDNPEGRGTQISIALPAQAPAQSAAKKALAES